MIPHGARCGFLITSEPILERTSASDQPRSWLKKEHSSSIIMRVGSNLLVFLLIWRFGGFLLAVELSLAAPAFSCFGSQLLIECPLKRKTPSKTFFYYGFR
jgi:hypothetical protein